MTQLRQAIEQVFVGDSEMAMLMRSYDWTQTSLGAVETWPQSLRSALSICLNSRFPIAIYWGQDFILLYNDAWRPILGDKHDWALGYSAREVWSEIWDEIGPELAGVMATGKGTFHKDELLSMHRFGYTEECFFEYTFNPVQGEGGVVEGVFNIVTETTYRVLNDRRAQLLREVASKTGIAKTAEAACALLLEALQSDPFDIPFALLYLIDADGNHAHLCNSIEFALDGPVSPTKIDLVAEEDSNGWLIALATRTAQPQVIPDLVARFGTLPGSPWAEPPQEAMVWPIAAPGHSKVSAVLVLVASPRRRLDDHYRDFFTQVAGQVAMAIAIAQTYEEERKRAEALAELDRAKTTFFSNISHEFRTPLTLMLGPLQETLNRLDGQLPPDEREQLQMVQHNGLRLLKLVNTLLDFSRIEAGRVKAVYEPTDLAAFTTDLASVFRSTIEQAGLQLIVTCESLTEPVYVDREMWEKIVLNLLSNAFKFTFSGEIVVTLHQVQSQVELTVRDTGIGIPIAELPRLFERFHRVEGAQGRTQEGSGIGLALVQELVRLHGGQVEVASTEGAGTTFTVTVPMGMAHLPAERVQPARSLTLSPFGATPYVEEALRWLPEEAIGTWEYAATTVEVEQTAGLPHRSLSASSFPPARLLLADDNADMRSYVKRLLLSQGYAVETAPDGMAALAMAQQQVPDLVLTDVMMPRLDGFGLLEELRAAPTTREIPVILLSARAGEEARVEGLTAGADDYLVKPFSARELQARVEATLKLSKLRREALQQEQALRAMSETAQQQAEAAFRRIDQLLESMSEAFIALDRDWRIVYQNATAERINNKPRSQVLGKTLWEEWSAAMEPISEQQYRHAVAKQVAVHFEQHYYEPPDHDVWLEVHAYPFEEGLGIFYRDVSERKRAEELSQRAAALDAFRVSLADALRPLTDASDIQAIAARILGESLRATRVIYIEVISDGEEVIVHRNYTSGVAAMSGRYRLEDYRRNLTADHQAGHTQIVTDIPNNPKYTDAEKAKYRELDIAAHIDVPLIKNDQFVALLAVHQSTPRQWTETEVKLVEETADRTWAAVERARTEALLRASHDTFRYLVETSPFGVYTVDADFRLAQVSAGAQKIFENVRPLIGHDFAEVLRVLWPEPFASEAIARFRHTLETGEPYHAPSTIERRHDIGEVESYDWKLERIALPDGRFGVVCHFYDLSERQRYEAALRDSEERFRHMADNAPVMVWVTDPTGYCTYLSQSWYNFTGQTEETGLGFGWLSRVHPKDYEMAEQTFLNANQRQEAFSLEYRLQNKQGEYIWAIDAASPRFGVEGQFQGYIGSVLDISDRKRVEDERKQAEAALREGENRLRLALASAKLGTWDFNPITGVLQWDDQCKAMFGLSPEAEVNYDVFLAGLHPEDRDCTDQVVQFSLNPESGGEYDIEYRTIGIEDGVERWIAAKGKAFFNPAGIAIRFIGTVLNMTEKKQAEAEREHLLQREQSARETAERANQIKDEFLAVLSHELRSPLNPILGWSKLLQQGKLDATRTMTALTTIERNAQLQTQLIDDLLDTSRILRGKLNLEAAPVNLSEVVVAALETVHLAAEAKSLSIQTSISSEVGTVVGDAGRLQQVVWNLLSNAVKFTPQNGQISVTVTLTQTGTHAQIQVRDTGKGIKPDFLPFVFEHFRQEDGATTRRFGGLGLGLAIARQIVEMHGGQIRVDSLGEGQGATFTVEIPLAPPSSQLPSESASISTEGNLQGVSILVVDDESDSRELVAFVLEQAGARVTSVSSGIEALQAVELAVPDLIVSDIGMPEMDGYMLLRQVRTNGQGQQDIPAIALTAYAGEFDRQQALQAGFQQHLPKPIEPEKLISAICTLCGTLSN